MLMQHDGQIAHKAQTQARLCLAGAGGSSSSSNDNFGWKLPDDYDGLD
jgi:hypothetical protein